MALIHSPNSITSGLVLCVDAANPKSYPAQLPIQYLIVAGGGAGGGGGGAGGAGGVLTGNTTITGITYNIVVGGGGTGTTTATAGQNGNNTTAFGLTAIAGGGGSGLGAVAGSGGSGGGGNRTNPPGSGTAGQGNSGGTGAQHSTQVWTVGGGGGGAGAVGQNANVRGTDLPGNGGAGVVNPITGSTIGQLSGGLYYIGGGGGGGTQAGTQNGGAGGLGGGGAGGQGTAVATNGTANTGGGGGSGNEGGSVYALSGNGGSGVVVIRYEGPARFSGGAVTSVDGFTIHTFTTSSALTPLPTWLDLSGRGNNGTLINSPSFNSNNLGSLTFNGTNTYVDCGNAASLSAIGGTTNITVSAWVFYTAYTGGGGQPYSVITVKGNPWTWLMENPSNILRFRITAGGVDTAVADTATHLLNRWYNVVGTYDGGNMRIYVDGVLKNTLARTGTLATNAETAKIGTFQPTNYNFNGQISQVSIYNLTLTDSQINQNFQALRGRYGI